MDRKQKAAKEKKPLASSRALRSGAYAGALCAIALAVCVAVNVFAAAVPSKYKTVDMTDEKLYTLSDETKQVADSLTQDVTMYYLARTGSEDDNTARLLDAYDALPHVNVVRKDPVVYPNFAAAYDASTAAVGSIIVDGGSRYKVVSADSLYTSTPNYETYSYDTSFAGESAITGALSYVASEVLPKVYTLTGHGEADLSSGISSGLSNQNMEVASLSLLTEAAVPDDADVLVMNAPTRDLSADEAKKLSDYLAKGGSLYLTTANGACSAETMPNLAGVLSAWGLSAKDGVVIEGDTSKSLSNYPYYLLPDLNSHDITDPLISNKSYVLVPMAHAISVASTLPENVETTNLLTTSDSAYLKTGLKNGDSIVKSDGDETGTFCVAVAADNTSTNAKLVWVSSGVVMDENTDSMVSGGNTDFVLNGITWMTDAQTGITIHAKSMQAAKLTVPAAGVAMWGTLFTIGTPVVLLLAGLVIWLVRRKK